MRCCSGHRAQFLSVNKRPAVRVSGRPEGTSRGFTVGSVIKKRRKRMAKKKHRKLLKKTRIQRRRAGK